MKVVLASILLLTSVYLLAFPAWIVQVFGATLASIGFILSADLLLANKSARVSDVMIHAELMDEDADYGDYRAEIEAIKGVQAEER